MSLQKTSSFRRFLAVKWSLSDPFYIRPSRELGVTFFHFVEAAVQFSKRESRLRLCVAPSLWPNKFSHLVHIAMCPFLLCEDCPDFFAKVNNLPPPSRALFSKDFFGGYENSYPVMGHAHSPSTDDCALFFWDSEREGKGRSVRRRPIGILLLSPVVFSERRRRVDGEERETEERILLYTAIYRYKGNTKVSRVFFRRRSVHERWQFLLRVRAHTLFGGKEEEWRKPPLFLSDPFFVGNWMMEPGGKGGGGGGPVGDKVKKRGGVEAS